MYSLLYLLPVNSVLSAAVTLTLSLLPLHQNHNLLGDKREVSLTKRKLQSLDSRITSAVDALKQQLRIYIKYIYKI